MRRKKPTALVYIIFILYFMVIFSGAEQDKRRRITNYTFQDINSTNYYYPLQQRYVPGEIIVKFKMPLSDIELANLLDKYHPKIIGASRMLNGSYVIRFPENYSVEQMIQVIERNPYVEYAETNEIARIPELPKERDESFIEIFPSVKRKRIKEVGRIGMCKNIEKTHKASGEKKRKDSGS